MKKTRPSFKKRQKEMGRVQKQMDKQAQRKARGEQKANAPAKSGDEDPDLAGIRPGPQPLPWEWPDSTDRDPSKKPSEGDA